MQTFKYDMAATPIISMDGFKLRMPPPGTNFFERYDSKHYTWTHLTEIGDGYFIRRIPIGYRALAANDAIRYWTLRIENDHDNRKRYWCYCRTWAKWGNLE